MKLTPSLFEKPWGRTTLPPPFGTLLMPDGRQGQTIGEIWFEPEDRAHLPLLVKYMFTGEQLSVQVHPNDEQARMRGHRSGKNECWYIVDAEPGAKVALGTTMPLEGDALRKAALDGSIETMLAWWPVRTGDFLVVPAGTLHTIGAGISLIEFQQNIDLTYRLYDYGRPRELHLDRGVGVAVARPHPGEYMLRVDHDGAVEQPLAHFPQFDTIFSRDIMLSRAHRAGREMWIVPLDGEVTCEGETVVSGDCLYVAPGDKLSASADATALIGIAA